MVHRAESFDASDGQALERDIAACHELAGPGAREEPASEATVAEVREATLRAVRAERGLAAVLRSLATWKRVGLVVLAVSLVTVATLLASPRFDLGIYPPERMAVTLVAFAGLAVLAAWRLLRPLHRPPFPGALGVAICLAAALAPLVAALVPLGSGAGHAPAGEGVAFASHCGRCLLVGAGLGAPVLVAALLARRAAEGGVFVTVLGGAVAGLAGNLVLQVHCPIVAPAHLVVGHAVLMAPFVIAALLWRMR
jgi:hypothetical protein